MVITNRMEKFYDDGNDSCLYRVTNDLRCNSDPTGDPGAPGLNVRIKYLNREEWNIVLKSLQSCEEISDSAITISKPAMNELLYLLFSGGADAGIGWKITAVEVLSHDLICMDLHDAGMAELRRCMERRMRELREETAAEVPDLTDWILPDQFSLYWKLPSSDDHPIVFEVARPAGDRQSYTFGLYTCGVEVEEKRKRSYRSLKFVNTVETEKCQRIADVVVTEVHQ